MVALLLIGVVSSASATVYVFYYVNATSTVQNANITLAAGTDASGSCSAYPCATVSISSTSDTATVTMSMFKADTSFNPPPTSYYTNLVQVKDATTGHQIQAVQILNVASSSPNDFGKITVYYCTAQTQFLANGSLAAPANCVGSFAITSTTGGSVSGSFPVSISASGTNYIELSAYAGSTATVSDTVTFKIAVEWV